MIRSFLRERQGVRLYMGEARDKVTSGRDEGQGDTWEKRGMGAYPRQVRGKVIPRRDEG